MLIRRGSFTSVQDLIAAIEAFIDGWNDRCHPFTWTKTADEVSAPAYQAAIRDVVAPDPSHRAGAECPFTPGLRQSDARCPG